MNLKIIYLARMMFTKFLSNTKILNKLHLKRKELKQQEIKYMVLMMTKLD